MVIWHKTLRMLGIITFVLGTTPMAGMAADGAVEFTPHTSYVIPQQTFEVDIQVDVPVIGIHCFMVTIDFDRSLLELLTVTEGLLMQTQGETFFFSVDTAGAYDIGICLLGNGLAADGPGLLATLTFQAQFSLGSTDLEFSVVDFSDENLNPLAVNYHNGVVTISEACCVGRVGNANGIGGDEPTIGDIAVLIDAKFITGTCVGVVACLTEGDTNQSGGLYPTCDDISIGDIAILIDYLFITGQSVGLVDCL